MGVIGEDIAKAARTGQPVQVHDAAGREYVVMTCDQFARYVYDDSDLTPDEMLAAALATMDDGDEPDEPRGTSDPSSHDVDS